MEDQAKPKPISLQLEQARQLLELGHGREALALALDALLLELHNLQQSLKALEQEARPAAPDPAGQPGQPVSRVIAPKTRIFH